MRTAIVLALVGLGFLLAAPLASAGSLACDLGDRPIADDERILSLLDGAEDIQAMLGPQLAGWWMSGRDQGWDLGVAPGALTVDEARTAIQELLSRRLAPDDVGYLMSTLHLYEMPYGFAELRAVVDELDAGLQDAIGDRIFWVVDIGCLDGEAWRVEIGLYDDATSEDIAAVRELAAPYGDRVRIYPGGLVVPPNASGTEASYMRAFVKLRSARRCVHARRIVLKTRHAARRVIRRVTVTVDGRRRVLAGDRLTIRLRRAATRVKVVVRVGDGTRLARTYVFRRC